jgi:hypothetical protein
MPRLSAVEVIANQKAHQRYCAVRAMHQVAAADEQLTARLRALSRSIREGQKATKQEPAELAGSTGSNRSTPVCADGRAASAQHDRGR